jgi:hypothetical protein
VGHSLNVAGLLSAKGWSRLYRDIADEGGNTGGYTMSDWVNAPDGISAWHERHNTPQDWDRHNIGTINMIADHKELRLYVTIPSGPGHRDVFMKITADRLVDLSIAVQANKVRALEAQIAALKADKAALAEGRNTIADTLYAIKEQTEKYEHWSAMHEAKQRAHQRAIDEAEAAARTAAEA